MMKTLAAVLLFAVALARAQSSPIEAVTVTNGRVLLAGKTSVTGLLNLTETSDKTGVRILGRIEGLAPGLHGFHVHQLGDVFSNGCDSTGPHFNPAKALHGSPHDPAHARHAGDLGNIAADDKGVALVDIFDGLVTLTSGPNNILGRAFVVHEKVDDLGKGGDDGSTKTGNAGSRLACGIVFLTA